MNRSAVFFEELSKGNEFTKPCKSTNIDNLTNCFIFHESVIKAVVETSDKNIAGSAEWHLSGPEARANASLTMYILQLADDWLNSKRGIYSPTVKKTNSSETNSQSNDEQDTESPISVTPSFRNMHFSFVGNIDPGVVNLNHSIQDQMNIKNLFPFFTSRSTRYRPTADSSLLAKAPLPRVRIECVHKSPISYSDTTSADIIRSNTHAQVNVHWQGVRLAPSSVLFWEEMALNFQEYTAMKKEAKRQHRSSVDSRNLKSRDEDKIMPRPLSWMRLAHAVILIQRVYRGYRTRKLLKENGSKSKYSRNQRSGQRSSASTPMHNVKRKTSNSQDISLRTNTVSFLLRIDPFEIVLTCSPVSEVSTKFIIPQPMDLLYTRTFRSIKTEDSKGIALFDNVFISLPEAKIRLHHHLAPPDCISAKVSGITANLGRENSGSLREDDGDIFSAVVDLDRILVQGNLPQLHQFFMFYLLWTSRAEDAKDIIEKSQTETSFRKLYKKYSSDELSLKATNTYTAVARIHQFEIQTDLGRSVGKQELAINDIMWELRDRGRFHGHLYRDPLSTELFIRNAKIDLTGRLHGNISLSGLAFRGQHFFRSPIMEGGQFSERETTELKIVLAPCDIDLNYHEKIFSLSSLEHVAKFRDTFSMQDGIEAIVSSDRLDLFITSQTVPSVIKIGDRLVSQINERHAVAVETLKTANVRLPRKYMQYSIMEKLIPSSSSHSSSLSTSQRDTTSPRRSSTSSRFLPYEILNNLKVVGLIVIRGQHFGIRFNGVTAENNLLSISSESFRLQLERSFNRNNDMVLRDLSMFLSNSLISKQKPLRNGNDRVSKIMEMPGALIEMNSRERTGSSKVNYRFLSQFPKPIRISTYLSEYNDIREIFSTYLEEITAALKAHPSLAALINGNNDNNDDKTTDTTKQSKDMDQYNDDDNDLDIDKNDYDDNGKTAQLSSSHKTESANDNQRRFVGDEFQLEPRLDVLGEMTPRVETVLSWLGIKDKSAIPAATHRAVTDSLESSMLTLHHISTMLSRSLQEH